MNFTEFQLLYQSSTHSPNFGKFRFHSSRNLTVKISFYQKCPESLQQEVKNASNNITASISKPSSVYNSNLHLSRISSKQSMASSTSDSTTNKNTGKKLKDISKCSVILCYYSDGSENVFSNSAFSVVFGNDFVVKNWNQQVIAHYKFKFIISAIYQNFSSGDIIFGFSTGEILLLSKQRYARFNKDTIKKCVTSIEVLPRSERVILVSFEDGLLCIIDLDQEEKLTTIEDCGGFSTHSLQAYLQLVAHNKKRNPYSIWKLFSTGRPAKRLIIDTTESFLSERSLDKCKLPIITDISFTESFLIVSTSEGGLHFINIDHSEHSLELCSAYYTFFGGIICCCISEDESIVAIGGQDDLITVIDIDSFLQRGTCNLLHLEGHSNWVNAISILTFDDCYKIYSVGEDGFLCSWDIEKRHFLKRNMSSSTPSLDRLRTVERQKVVSQSRKVNCTCGIFQSVTLKTVPARKVSKISKLPLVAMSCFENQLMIVNKAGDICVIEI